MTIVDNAVYVDGVRTADPAGLDETYFVLRQREGMAWIGLYRPDAVELQSVAEEFDLNPLAVEDALAGHQRAKLEHYGECLFLVLRPARYLDDVEQVDFGEIHVFVGSDYVVTVRHAESPDLARVRRRMEGMPEFLALGPEAVLYGILDQVVDEYEPVAAGLENDVDEIEDDLFGADPDVSRRIYELSRQVITFQRATSPLVGILQVLMAGMPEFLALGPDAVLYGILDQVVDEYEPVAAGLENDVDEIEDDLFGADPDVSRRIYELSRQVITFQRATSPLVGILQVLMAGTPERVPGAELQDHFRDVLDHVIRLNERVASFRTLLQNALAVNAALVAQRQNDEMRRLTESSFAQSEQVKRISSWAAILFAPTLVGTIYGMNFRSMPELDWIFGYPFALGLMLAMGLGLYFTFKHNKWI